MIINDFVYELCADSVVVCEVNGCLMTLIDGINIDSLLKAFSKFDEFRQHLNIVLNLLGLQLHL